MSSKKLVNGVSSGCLTIFGLPFLAAGVFLSWLYFTPYFKYVVAQNWEKVPCRIDSATLKVHEDSDGDTYKCLASYRYEYAGRTWSSDRVSLYAGADNIGNFQHRAHRELSQYVAGKPAEAEWEPLAPGTGMFRCYVNPGNPAESVLYRDLRWQMQALIALFALTFPAVGAGLVFGGLIGILRTRQLDVTPGKLSSETVANESTDTPVPLIPESGTTTKIVLGIYTVWAAIVIAPLMVCAIACGAFHETPAAAFLIIYPLLWCIPAGFTLRHLRQHLMIGKARFEPAAAPASGGGLLAGNIWLDKRPPIRATAVVTLTCNKMITKKSSDGDSTTTEKIWEERVEVSVDSFHREISATRLPVSFNLPADAPPSGPSGQENIGHAWNLHFWIESTPIHLVFEVPVVARQASQWC